MRSLKVTPEELIRVRQPLKLSREEEVREVRGQVF
jgi:hypothetical protein